MPAVVVLGIAGQSDVSSASPLFGLLAIVALAAAVGGVRVGVAAAVAATFLANWYFTSPRHTLLVARGDDVIALIVLVAVADDVLCERVCAVVTLVPGTSLSLAEITAHLENRGLGKELWPEHLLVLEDLPRSSGGKLAKGELRRLAEAAVRPSAVGPSGGK